MNRYINGVAGINIGVAFTLEFCRLSRVPARFRSWPRVGSTQFAYPYSAGVHRSNHVWNIAVPSHRGTKSGQRAARQTRRNTEINWVR